MEERIKSLEGELQSVKADCGILIQENNELIDTILKYDKKHEFSTLFSAQWRREYEEEKRLRKGTLDAFIPV